MFCEDCGAEVVRGYYDQHGTYVWLSKETPMDTWCPVNRHAGGHRVIEDGMPACTCGGSLFHADSCPAGRRR